ncbi:hypothetical protein SeMB42_g04573 [Synchytrium endobioticum]|uniref:1,4-dihydroxy-2-naphthoate octaprenyltransferase n=1 Tax=Synchytrium endobioticum TaxID=286115 RepID=A0A507DEF9_9FUNG|nr:hypothetical protein SeMB42_g04573 [Synchytrium endobioticum]TPX49637.1 hypothetical protein SeLEV6574_g01366 [Synchytrium endobioticum]
MAINDQVLHSHDLRRRPLLTDFKRNSTHVSIVADAPVNPRPQKPPLSLSAKIKLFAKLCRIKYLVVTPFFISAALPYVLHQRSLYPHLGMWTACLVTGFLIQILAMLCNEYYDLEADTANKTPSSLTGGSRILVDHLLHPSVALYGAIVVASLIVALQFIVPALLPWYARGRELMLIATFLSWSYSGPPLYLNYRGLGELNAAIVVALICPLYPAIVHLPAFDAKSVLVALLNPFDADGALLRNTIYAIAPFPLVYISRYCCLNINDMEGDMAANKKNWAVLFGARMTARISVGLQILAFVVALDQFLSGFIPLSLAIPLLGYVLPAGMYETGRLWYLMPASDDHVFDFIAKRPASKRAVVASTYLSIAVAFVLCVGWAINV